MSEPVRVERYGSRGELVINRPDDQNRITWDVLSALEGGLVELLDDTSVGSVLLRGSRHLFSAGLDQESLRSVGDPLAVVAVRRRLHACLLDSPKTTVVALEGTAIGGAAALALSCDLVVAGQSAGLWLPEVAIDMVATMNLAILRLKHTEALALELALSARPFVGAELAQRGLAHEVAPDRDVVARARALADGLAGHVGPSVAHTKRLVRALGDVGSAAEYLEWSYARHESTSAGVAR